MSFKLSKEDRARKIELVNQLREWQDRVNDSIAVAQDKMKDALVDVNDVIDTYNEKVEEVREFVERVASDFRSDFEDKSEGWQEGERGQTVGEFIDAWENLEINQVDRITLPDVELDDEIELPNDLEELAEEVE